MKKLIVILAIVLCFLVVIFSQDEYPCGFAIVYGLVKMAPKVSSTTQGFECFVPGLVEVAGITGKVGLAAGLNIENDPKAKDMVGCILQMKGEDGDELLAVGVFYNPRTQIYLGTDMLNNKVYKLTPKQACQFVDNWLELFKKATVQEAQKVKIKWQE